jgi:RHS repeat-associated protein
MNQEKSETQRQGTGGIGVLRQFWGRRLGRVSIVVALLAGAGAVAQVTTEDPPPEFCYQGISQICRDTLEKAEQAMRNAPANASIAQLLEQAETNVFPATESAAYIYRVKDQPGTLHSGGFTVDGLNSDGSLISGGHGCIRGDDPNQPELCADEDELVARAVDKYRWLSSQCTFGAASLAADLRVAPYKEVESNASSPLINYGIVNYGHRHYTTQYSCNDGKSGVYTFRIRKEASFTCPFGYNRLGDAIPNDGVNDLTLPVLCKYNRGSQQITGPIQQCASCEASPYPVYPATGDKARAEVDFEFAGRPFTRYYHSLRQFRNNVGFAVGWSHTFSDRVVFGINGTNAAAIVDDAGTYEGYAPIGNNRLRGQNSTDTVLEYVQAAAVRWRQRLPDGEVREFNADRQLTAIRDPDDARLDVLMGYANGLLATLTDGQGRKVRFRYNSAKLMTRVELPDGEVIVYDYDGDRNLTTVDYGSGRVRQYHYAEPALIGDATQRNHMTGITAETGDRFASFRYDARGRIVESRVFGTPNHVTTVRYDSQSQATVTTADNEQRVYTILPGLYRRITGVRTVGQTTQDAQLFDTLGRLQRSTDRKLVHTDYEYHATDHYLSATVEAVGTPDQRRQDTVRDPATNRITEQSIRDATGQLKAQTQWIYNSRAQPVSVKQIDPATGDSRTATITYCEAGDVALGTCPQVGLVTSVDGARSNPRDSALGNADVTRYEYRAADAPECAATPAACAWRKGDLWRIVDAESNVTELLAYDGDGRVKSIRDANGVTTDLQYDPRGWLLASKVRGADDASEADDRIERIEYTADGQVHRVIQPDGVYVTFGYDDARRLTSIADRDGNAITYTLNAAGERLSEETRDAGGDLLRKLSSAFDTLGRLEAQTDAYQHSTGFLYDAEDNLSLMTDALGRKTAYDHDALGRLRTTLEDMDGIAALTQVQYDALDQVKQITDPNGLSTLYDYNGFGDLVSQQSPDTRTTSATHDEAGNIQTRTDGRGVTATYAYDALDRMTAIAYPDSSRNVSYAYDTAPAACPNGERFAKGRLAATTDPSGGTGYCYDRYGHVARKLQTTQGRTYVLRYLHTDPLGRLPGETVPLQNPPPGNQMIGMTYPDGSGVRIVRDAQARPMELRVLLANGQTQPLLSSATYYPFGPASRWTFGNGRVLRRSLNDNYQPDAVEDTTPGGINEGYGFNEVGNLASLRHANQIDPPRRSYTYDGMNRLTHVREGASGPLLQAYAYDATGNRTARTDGGTTSPYSYSFAGPGPGRHHLQSVGAQSRGYDSVGNTTRIAASSVPAVREFDYDDANRMHAVRHDGVVAMRYLYNAMGERVHRAGSGIAVATLYDEDGKWIGDYDANGQPIQQVVWLDDLPVGLLVGAGANQKLYYIEADALGTPRVVIDPTRNVAVWKWNLANEAFGDSAPNQDVDGDGTAFVFDMRFPGQRYDSATGLNYNYFRDYDPGTGRYAQSDPIGLDGGMSTYGYVNGSPLVYSDPEGMFAALVLRFAMRYALPQAGLRLGATHAVKRVAPRLVREQIKRLAKRATARQAYCPSASNSAAHQAYKDSLRTAMSKPAVSDPKLARIIDPLYRANATVGSGSAAAAVRQELATGLAVGGRFHSQKAADSIKALGKWLDKNPTARPGDIAAAQNVIRDMTNALRGLP